MQMFEAYLCFWKNYFNFSGRARRSEYWFSYIVNFIVAFLLKNLSELMLAFSEVASVIVFFVYFLYLLASITPSMAVFIRRMHDSGKSGACFFIGLIPIIGNIIVLVLLFLNSQPGTNKYGVSPKYPDADIVN